MSSIGISIALQMCVGKAMGAKNVPLAKKYLFIANIYSFVMYLILCGIILLLKHEIASLFTNQPEILHHVLEGFNTAVHVPCLFWGPKKI